MHIRKLCKKKTIKVGDSAIKKKYQTAALKQRVPWNYGMATQGKLDKTEKLCSSKGSVVSVVPGKSYFTFSDTP